MKQRGNSAALVTSATTQIYITVFYRYFDTKVADFGDAGDTIGKKLLKFLVEQQNVPHIVLPVFLKTVPT